MSRWSRFPSSGRAVGHVLAGLVVGVLVVVIGPLVFEAMAADAGSDDGAAFVAIEPCRLLDTRPTKGIGGRTTPLGPAEALTVQGSGVSGHCDVPADAVGLVLNVTADQATSNTNLRLYPTGGVVPTTSNLNPRPGAAPTPNAVVVGVDGAGRFDIRNAKGEVHVIIDVAGYFTTAPFDGLHATIEQLENEDGLLQADIAGLGDGLDGVWSDVSSLSTELDDLGATVEGLINDLADANDDIAALEARVVTLETDNAALQADVDALETLTASMSLETVDTYPVVRFSGVNVQVVDGSGDTDGGTNGLGNLIVGYHENDADTRTGSHNLVLGMEHSYSNYAGVVTGLDNSVTGIAAAAIGGEQNTVAGNRSAAIGGLSNTTSMPIEVVVGGADNDAAAQGSVIVGGQWNGTGGLYSVVSGGQYNETVGGRAVAIGGLSNDAVAWDSVAAGGAGNTTSGSFSVVAGGSGNTSSGQRDVVAGGDGLTCNDADDDGSSLCAEGTVSATD